jgi:hypothetical protein
MTKVALITAMVLFFLGTAWAFRSVPEQTMVPASEIDQQIEPRPFTIPWG